MTETSRRQYYRVVYPITARPELVVKDVTCEVADCSETGLCFLTPDNIVPPRLGEALNGVIRFKSGEEISVAGSVVRVDTPAVGVQLTRNKGHSVCCDHGRTALPSEALLEAGGGEEVGARLSA